MKKEWESWQVKHPAWDLHGGSHYLRPDPAFSEAESTYAAGPPLRRMVAQYYEWSRDGKGNEEPWPWVWAQKPSIGAVVVVIGSSEAAAAALADICTSRPPLLTTVIAVGDEAELIRRGVGIAGSPTEKIGIIDAAVHCALACPQRPRGLRGPRAHAVGCACWAQSLVTLTARAAQSTRTILS